MEECTVHPLCVHCMHACAPYAMHYTYCLCIYDTAMYTRPIQSPKPFKQASGRTVREGSPFSVVPLLHRPASTLGYMCITTRRPRTPSNLPNTSIRQTNCSGRFTLLCSPSSSSLNWNVYKSIDSNSSKLSPH